MGIDVLTNRYNNARTGANLNETLLNQSNVNVPAKRSPAGSLSRCHRSGHLDFLSTGGSFLFVTNKARRRAEPVNPVAE